MRGKRSLDRKKLSEAVGWGKDVNMNDRAIKANKNTQNRQKSGGLRGPKRR